MRFWAVLFSYQGALSPVGGPTTVPLLQISNVVEDVIG